MKTTEFRKIKKLFKALLAALCLTLLSSCRSTPDQVASTTPTVTVSRAIEELVMEWDEYPARLESPEIVNVTPRVGGEIVAAPYVEGGLVEKGAILFVIDERPYKAELESKEGAVTRALATSALAEINLKRFENVRDSKAISATDLDTARVSLQQAKADLASAKAAADITRLNLEWTKVSSPISGRAGRKLVTVGNLAAAAQGLGTTLTTVASLNPMYTYVNVPESAYLRYRELEISAEKLANNCAIRLENEGEFSHDGRIDFVDNKVDPQTGTIQMRCTVPNPEADLTPGLFARLRLPGSNLKKQLLIPDRAIGTEQGGRFVLVLDPNNQTESRRVKLGSLFGQLRAITEGISTNELIVTNGIQYARAGTKVSPKEEITTPDLIPAEFRSVPSSQTSFQKNN